MRGQGGSSHSQGYEKRRMHSFSSDGGRSESAEGACRGDSFMSDSFEGGTAAGASLSLPPSGFTYQPEPRHASERMRTSLSETPSHGTLKAGGKGQTPMSRRAASTSRRANSADPKSPMMATGGDDSRRAEAGEQRLSTLLQREIEATSLKMSAQRRAWRPRGSGTPGVTDSPREGHRSRLFVVSARLPFTVLWDEESGGFASEQDVTVSLFFEMNIKALLEQGPENSSRRPHGHGPAPVQVILVGAPVVRRSSDRTLVHVFDGQMKDDLDSFLRTEMQVVPVFPPPGRDRFADSVIFPLFHYSPPSVETGLGIYDWEGYEIVNSAFCDTVLKEHSRGDLVWINDYPLMLLPKLLRAERPDICIGFYMHCVFPSSEVYRILPQREDLLRGILSSNIIGFHNFQYVRHFLTSCTRVLGLECSANSIEACEDAGGTCTKVFSVPLGINTAPFQAILNQEETKVRIAKLKESFPGLRILAAVDRLEEKKGIPHKIMAFHKFLQKAPAWAHQCVFVQILVLREEANEDEAGELSDEKQLLLQQVYQMAGEVNSKFGSIGHLPFHFLYQEFKKVDVAALLSMAHVFVDTPLRDTLSQPAHEYLYCQHEKDCGVLILSEFSGSAQSLRAAAICVNPWDTVGFADAFQEALEMEAGDRNELHRYGHRHVAEYNLSHWAMNFLEELQTAEHETESERLQIPPPLDHDLPVSAWRKAKKRLVVLGFAGTLLPRKSKIHAKILPKLPPVLLGNLQVIAEDPCTQVIVVSGFARHTVAQALSGVPCWIIAEGGVCYRKPFETEFVSALDEQDLEWLGPVREIMDYFAARTPGSNVVETSSSVSWHYQKTQGDHAALQSKDLLIHLWAGPLLSAPAEVVVGNDAVSVRPTGVTKASQLESLIQQICCETSEKDGAVQMKEEWLNGDSLVLCVTDLITRDEEVFATLHKMFEKTQQDGHDDEKRLLERSSQAEPEDTRRRELGWTSPPQTTAAEELHLEANSKSLNEVYSSLSMVATGRASLEFEENDGRRSPPGLWGLHGGGGSSASRPSGGLAETLQALLSVKTLKRTESEPGDSHAYQAGVEDCFGDHAQEQQTAAGAGENMDEGPKLYTCTIHRKATRAMYHLSDTNDLAFLLAKIAREVRQSKEVTENDHPALSG